ncbi:MAG: hypothetical protein EOO12_05800 [Chitinophagaceae bacterium]|nr:MAG: hypothetical protein EOO12_05800 [Chitinophagaceae bacterium]
MKNVLFLLALALPFAGKAQAVDSIQVPARVVYKYSAPALVEQAKVKLRRELSGVADYSLTKGVLFIGPGLWQRYSRIAALAAIPGGNMTILFDGEKLNGKMTQDKDGFTKVWNQVRAELKDQPYTLRKATYQELDYYWSVINFDIEEPLLIADAGAHRYILQLSNDLRLLWLDEVPPR